MSYPNLHGCPLRPEEGVPGGESASPAVARGAHEKERRPRCGAKTRGGSPCHAPAVWDRARHEPRNGRCRFHGGLSTGPRSEEGRARIAAAQRRRWTARRASKTPGEAVGPVPPPVAAGRLPHEEATPQAPPRPKPKSKTPRLPRRRRPPPKLTPEFAARFCELVGKGHTPEIVAWVCRVPWEIAHRWLWRGLEDRERGRRNRFVAFLTATEKAAMRARTLGVNAMFELANGYQERDETVRQYPDGTREIRAVVRQKVRPEAALWLLERLWPDEWSPRRRPRPARVGP